jgi:hypothetical protein
MRYVSVLRQLCWLDERWTLLRQSIGSSVYLEDQTADCMEAGWANRVVERRALGTGVEATWERVPSVPWSQEAAQEQSHSGYVAPASHCSAAAFVLKTPREWMLNVCPEMFSEMFSEISSGMSSVLYSGLLCPQCRMQFEGAS